MLKGEKGELVDDERGKIADARNIVRKQHCLFLKLLDRRFGVNHTHIPDNRIPIINLLHRHIGEKVRRCRVHDLLSAARSVDLNEPFMGLSNVEHHLSPRHSRSKLDHCWLIQRVQSIRLCVRCNNATKLAEKER